MPAELPTAASRASITSFTGHLHSLLIGSFAEMPKFIVAGRHYAPPRKEKDGNASRAILACCTAAYTIWSPTTKMIDAHFDIIA